MTVFTKRGANVFAPNDAAGSPRSIDPGEAQVWSTEVEVAIESLHDEFAAHDDAVADLASAAATAASTAQGYAQSIANRIEEVEDLIASMEDISAAGYLFFDTKSDLDADTGQTDGTRAWVDRDSTATNNGLYVSESGVWTKIGESPITETSHNSKLAAGDRLRIADLRSWAIIPTLGETAWPAQEPLELGLSRASDQYYRSMTGLLESVSAGAIAHEWSMNGEYLGWKLEAARTNLYYYSSDFSQSYWSKARSTHTANAAIGPDGLMSAARFLETTDSGAHGPVSPAAANAAALSLTSGKTYTASFVVKGIDRDYAAIQIDGFSGVFSLLAYFALADDGLMVYAGSYVDRVRRENLGDGWFRIELTFTSAETTKVRSFVASAVPSGGSATYNFAGDTSKGLYVWHAQFEEGGFASSPIMSTAGAATARPATALTKSIGSAPQGTVFVRFRAPKLNAATLSRVCGVYVDSSNYAYISINSGATLYGGFQLGGNAGTVGATVITEDTEYLAAISWKNGEQQVAINGVITGTAAIANTVTGSATFQVGNAFNGHVREAFFWPIALSASALRAVTRSTRGAGSDEWSSEDTVSFAFVEPWTDPSADAVVTWVSSSNSAKTLEYREEGEETWNAVIAQRSRAFPSLTGMYLHSANFDTLSPETVYEIRVPGSSFEDTFKTAPYSDVRVAMMSDYQSSDFSASSKLADFGSVVRDEAIDLLIMDGDYISDNGVINTTTSTAWLNFMARLATEYRNNGALIPMIAAMGNHEGAYPGLSWNAQWNGAGIPGQTPTIFNFGYAPGHPTTFDRGVARLMVGSELMVLMLETDHTVPLDSQIEWFEEQLADYADDVRSIIVVGHCPAFLGMGSYEFEHDSQSRVLRNQFWPAMAPYADKIRFYLAGHEHILAITDKLQVDYDPGLSLAANDTRFFVDPVNGVRQIGSGPCGYLLLDVDNAKAGLVSSIDGSSKMIAAMGYSGGAYHTFGTGITNPSNDTANIWVAEFTAASFEAKAVNTNGDTLYEITESL